MPSADATAAVVASLSKPPEAAPSSPPAAPPASAGAGSPRADAEAPVKPAPDPLKVVGELRAAPLAPQDQVQVLELVTQMAAMVRALRAQDAQLRADFGKAAADNAARLADFERRLALTEARNAVSAARTAGEPTASVAPAPDSSREQGFAGAGTEAAGAPALPMKRAPVPVTAAATALPPAAPTEQVRGLEAHGAGPSDQGAAKRYRVQAASPGLALLAEVDRSGGDGAQLEVLVGDKIPGYGKVRSIGQRGTAWVVATEHGNIQ